MKKIMFNDKFGLTEAVLNGKKTMTRRIIKCPKTFRGEPVAGFNIHRRITDKKIVGYPCMYDENEREIEMGEILPKYRIGEIVAVAQCYHSFYNDECDPRMFPSGAGWLNKMFVKPDLMPHQIQITDIRIQKLRDISDEDVIKEGFSLEPINDNNGSYAFHHEYVLTYLDKRGLSKQIRDMSAKEAYSLLIDKIYPNLLWGNPYVFIYEFKLVK